MPSHYLNQIKHLINFHVHRSQYQTKLKKIYTNYREEMIKSLSESAGIIIQTQRIFKIERQNNVYDYHLSLI